MNTTHSIQESNYSNNNFTKNVNAMVLCKVEDSERTVPFHAQTELPWAPQPFGIPSISSGHMHDFGCSITNLYMLEPNAGSF